MLSFPSVIGRFRSIYCEWSLRSAYCLINPSNCRLIGNIVVLVFQCATVSSIVFIIRQWGIKSELRIKVISAEEKSIIGTLPHSQEVCPSWQLLVLTWNLSIVIFQDYVDAFEKLTRQHLRDVQASEVIHVLIDCCVQVH